MVQQVVEPPCPCFGRQLRRFRDAADMGLQAFAAAVGSAVDMVDEVERGRRAVSPEWVQQADEVLYARGMLCAEAGECLSYHAGMVTDVLHEEPHLGPGPIRLPADFIMG
jgi:Helix-turn-helix domain